MKGIEYQKAMNNELAKRKPDYKTAYRLYVAMNEKRAKEGLTFLSMPNLEKRYKAHLAVVKSKAKKK